MRNNVYGIGLGGLFIGVLLGYFWTIFVSDLKFQQHIRKQTFDECFNYYADNSRQNGIHNTTIQTCKDRADAVEFN